MKRMKLFQKSACFRRFSSYRDYLDRRALLWDNEWRVQHKGDKYKSILDVFTERGADLKDTLVCEWKGQYLSLHSNAPETDLESIRGFSFPEAKDVFWHSSSHILGNALESHFEGALLSDGPSITPTDDLDLTGGFFYDFFLPENRTVSQSDLMSLQRIIKKLLQQKNSFLPMKVSLKVAMEMFSFNPIKLELLEKIPLDDPITLFRCGDFIDLCRGPHIANTLQIKAMHLTKVSSIAERDGRVMQRVYGISFPTKELLEDWKSNLLEASRRDHRIIGRDQKLYMMHESSKGNAFFLPHGTRIINSLSTMLRQEYQQRGFDEVITPQVYDKSLWETSGHWQNYKDDMFLIQNTCGHESDTLGLKPMNCPGHCLIFKHETRSYRDLPMRIADFSPLHRNEVSGALTGLTRLRRFHQDDAHIFCAAEQVESEIHSSLAFIRDVYQQMFGFKFDLLLSTRPEAFLGEKSQWDVAESALKNALHSLGYDWKLNEGDGAFYGPKIDIVLTDAIGRRHQCGTIQLDFQLPIQFELEFQKSDGTIGRPVMIHRAILGSFERMFAILTEHFGGKWPFWLSPRQCLVCPINSRNTEFARKVQERLLEEQFWVELDDSSRTLGKKIREAQLLRYNFIAVIGDEECDKETIALRKSQGNDQFVYTLEELINFFKQLKNNKN